MIGRIDNNTYLPQILTNVLQTLTGSDAISSVSTYNQEVSFQKSLACIIDGTPCSTAQMADVKYDKRDAVERIKDIFAQIVHEPGRTYFTYDPDVDWIAVETENDIIIGNLKILDDGNEMAEFLAEARRKADGHVEFSLPTAEAKAATFEYPPVLANNAEHGLIIEYKGFGIDVLTMPKVADDTTYAERVMFLTNELPNTMAMCTPVPASQTAALNSRIRRDAFQLARPTRRRGGGRGPRRPQEDTARTAATTYAASQAGRAAVTEVRASGAFQKPNAVEIGTGAGEPVAAEPSIGRPGTTGLPSKTIGATQGGVGKRGGNMTDVLLAEGDGVKIGQAEASEKGNRMLNNHKSIIVVLHPFPTSWDFIKEAHELGFEVWTSSTKGLHIPNDVISCIAHQLKSSVYEPAAVAREIGRTKVSLFYPGSEMAVISAAALSKTYNLPGNSVETAMKSRYKDIMRTELEKIAPDNIPKYAIITDRAELATAVTKIGFPAVFKRTDFAGSFGIKVVRNVQELEQYFNEQIAIKKLSYGQAVRPIYLLEEYVAGQEFSVEAVTIKGVTTVLGVTKKTVAGEPYFVEAKHEFPAQSFGVPIDVVNSLSKLAKRVTEALGFQFCVSHFEAKWDNKTNRPIIMEVASRTGGDNIPKLLKYVIGMHTWHPLVVDMLGAFSSAPPDIKPMGGASIQFTFLESAGIFAGISNLDQIRAHPAHKQDAITGEIGKYQRPTLTYRDRVGYFIGHSLDAKELEDYQKLVGSAKAIIRKSKATDENK